MSDGNTPKLKPPASWEEFEDACADLFERLWNFKELVRYGRQGQEQHGIDIYGQEDGAHVAAQCKQRRQWPPTKLTTADVDDTVEKAKSFTPKLAKLFIVTTAENDKAVTDHAEAINARHKELGLFGVHVYGWSELQRRFHNYPDLLEKHFNEITIRALRTDIQDLHKVAEQVLTQVNAAQVSQAGDGRQAPPAGNRVLAEQLAEAVERDLYVRYREALQRSMFPEAHDSDDFMKLSDEVMASLSSISPTLAQTILFRGARSAAIKEQRDQARRYLDAGSSFGRGVSDRPARARLAVAEGDADAAIHLVRDEKDVESRSVMLSLLALSRGDEAALQWRDEARIAVHDLSALGAINLAQIHLRAESLDLALGVLEALAPEQLAEGPYLYLMRGAIRFAKMFPTPDQPTILGGLPMDMRGVRPVAHASQLAQQLDLALDDLRQALPLAGSLKLKDAPRLIDTYILWCELIHPSRRPAAQARLREEIKDLRVAATRVELIYIADIDFDRSELEAYLQRRDTRGGWSDGELRAAISLCLNNNDPSRLAAIIAGKRAQADAVFGVTGIRMLEIQALAKRGDATSARIVFNDNRSLFGKEEAAILETEIAKAEGADPVAAHLALYEDNKTPETLRALVGQLHAKDDHIGVARYAEILFNETGALDALVLAAEANIQAGRGEELVRLVEANPALRETTVGILRHYGWQLYQNGRLKNAEQVAGELQQKSPDRRDLNLEIAIALESGEWEDLAGPLAAFLDTNGNFDGLALIRAAHLSHASGQGSLMDLVAAALNKSPEDANVLLGAYSIYIEEGLEEYRSEPHLWFRKALALSGPDGPIQSVELKELLEKQTEWNDHVRDVTKGMMRGDLPFVVAGPGLRTTVVDMILRNLVRNSAITDGRQRVAIPLFSGRRLPEQIPGMRRVALDISSVLVLGWLGILPTVLDECSEIVLPGGLLTELFESRRKIRITQKSRLQKATEIRAAIADRHLTVLRAPTLLRDNFAREIGDELAALLRAAESDGGLVLRPAPVHRLGMQEQRDADMTAHQSHLCDMHSLLRVLTDHNIIDEAAQQSAQRYFELQDKGWPASATPDPAKTLFVDGLSLVYLQYTGLLQAFFRTFKDVRIHNSTADEANVLIDHERHAQEVLRVIEDIRQTLRRVNAGSKITFGPRRAPKETREFGDTESTVNIIANLASADTVVIDDRALNKEPFVADESGSRARMVTTLDIIETLEANGKLSAEQRRLLRYRLRAAGALLVPVDEIEVVVAARKNRKAEAPEFQTIHQSLSLARLAEMPQFPSEMRWFMSYSQAPRAALGPIWNEEPDATRARSLSEAVLSLKPDPEDWVDLWGEALPPGWVFGVRRAFIAGFALPTEISDQTKIEPFQAWLEESVLSKLRADAPETYQGIVEYLRMFIKMPWKPDANES